MPLSGPVTFTAPLPERVNIVPFWKPTPLTVRALVELFSQVCDALAKAIEALTVIAPAPESISMPVLALPLTVVPLRVSAKPPVLPMFNAPLRRCSTSHRSYWLVRGSAESRCSWPS